MMPSFDTYLITPVMNEPASQTGLLLAAVEALKPVSILLRLPQLDERGQINLVKAVAPALQERGIAVLIDGPAQVAVRGGADGVHVPGPGLVAPAREIVKAERIVGSGGLKSRHDAMDAGEAGADYVMFGEPRPDGTTMILSALIERASWWAELFEAPCVAYCPDAAAIQPLAHTKAEFLALGPWCLADPSVAAERIELARAGLSVSAD